MYAPVRVRPLHGYRRWLAFLRRCGHPGREQRAQRVAGGQPAFGRDQAQARAAGRLHHTNIVPVHGVGHDAGRDYLVMQYIDGRALDQV